MVRHIQRHSFDSLENRALLTNVSVLSSGAGGAVVANLGSYLNGQNYTPDGHYAIFHSWATNLGPNDINSNKDVYWKDLWSGEVRPVSVTAGNLQANGDSTADAISSNGRYVLFHTNATNLNPNDTDTVWDMYLKDMFTGQLTLVSTSINGVKGNQNCVSSSPNTPDGPEYLSGGDVSSNGRFVVFDSRANNLVPSDNNNQSDVFLKDLQTGQIILLPNIIGGTPSGGSFLPRLTPDGKYAFYLSWSGDMTYGDNNGTWDLFRRDIATGSIICVSTNSAGQIGNSESAWDYDFTPDGRYVAFASVASNFVTGDTNGTRDIFIKDLNTGSIRRVSTGNQGEQFNATFWVGQNMTPDGRYVSFVTSDPIMSGDTNGMNDVYLKDTVTGSLILVSRTQSGIFSNGMSAHGNISSDGRTIVYQSTGSNIVSGDNNSDMDIFVWHNTPPVAIGDSFVVNGSLSNISNLILSNDSDIDGQILKPVLVSSPLHGSIIVQLDGSWTYQPASGYSGSDSFTYKVSDGPDVGNTVTVNLTVNASSSPSAVGVFRNGFFYFDANNNRKWDGTLNGDVSFGFGNSTDLPVTGDWNGDGVTDVGVFRNGQFYLDRNGNHKWDSSVDAYFSFGTSSDQPLSGDWNGDGKTDVGVYRDGYFYLDANGNRKWDGVAGGDYYFGFGAANDIPISGDWNGDGKTDIGTVRGATFYLDLNGNRKWNDKAGGDTYFNFGNVGDTPITGDWNGDGKTDVGMVRNGIFYLDSNGSRKWDSGDNYFAFGNSGDKVISGVWSSSLSSMVAKPKKKLYSQLDEVFADYN